MVQMHGLRIDVGFEGGIVVAQRWDFVCHSGSFLQSSDARETELDAKAAVRRQRCCHYSGITSYLYFCAMARSELVIRFHSRKARPDGCEQEHSLSLPLSATKPEPAHSFGALRYP